MIQEESQNQTLSTRVVQQIGTGFICRYHRFKSLSLLWMDLSSVIPNPRFNALFIAEWFPPVSWGFLRWLESVSTFPRIALIRRIGTTTLYHLLAILWYQMNHGFLLNKMQSLFWRNMSPWQRASRVKTPFILSLVAYILKTNSVAPIFYFWKVIRRARWNFLQGKKNYV